MNLLKKISTLTIGLVLIGCTDVIHVDLETADPKLVIDATLDWEKGTSGNEQMIKLSTSTGYYAPEFPTVSGAIIFVTNTADMVFDFTESENPGEYVCNDFIAAVGETYTLTVILNGETYTATETLTATPDIADTITQSNAGGIAGDELEIQFFYQDNGTQDNYYITSVRAPSVAYPEYSLESDEQYQGNQISQFYSHEDLTSGDLLNIRLYAVSRRYFDYFNKIVIASGNDNNPFQTTPTGVRGNIINQTDAQNFPLGYFRLCEVATRDYTME